LHGCNLTVGKESEQAVCQPVHYPHLCVLGGSAGYQAVVFFAVVPTAA